MIGDLMSIVILGPSVLADRRTCAILDPVSDPDVKMRWRNSRTA